MSVPSMVHRTGDTFVVRSVVSGDALYGSADGLCEESIVAAPDNLKDLPDCKVKRNYSCSTCDYYTQNPRHFLYHLRDVHKEKVRIYECPNCLYASKHFQKLLRHTRMVHGTSAGVETPELAARSKSRKRAAPPPPASFEQDDESIDNVSDTDETEVMKTTSFKCSVCAFTARSHQQLAKHEREEHIKTKFFRCSKCTYVTHMKARFTKHVKYHSMPMIKCDMCDFRTPYKWNLDRHCKNHNGRGAFRCSACNFTADIKQSLTVHEMNHHVPPVGQAAGFGVGRRRNKVGASDTAAAEEAALQLQRPVTPQANHNGDIGDTYQEDVQPKKIKTTAKPKTSLAVNSAYKKQKQPKADQSTNIFGSDFIHPDDIIQHANGNVYIKNKCKLCNFKSAWDGEMTKHEARVHSIVKEAPIKAKKVHRPIPNLIPIPQSTKFRQYQPPQENTYEPTMSQKDFNEICAKSTNSALKDFAPLFGSDNVFDKQPPQVVAQTSRVPDLIPAALYINPKLKLKNFEQKHVSIFDRLSNILPGSDVVDLTCKYCGHESKCLTEQVKHKKVCGTETNQIRNAVPMHNISSSRCQHCRQRCKSSTDLYNHLQTCLEAQKSINQAMKEELPQEYEQDQDEELELKIDIDENSLQNKDDDDDYNDKAHPMENKVFVWNNIVVPMDIDVDDSIYEYTDDKVDDNASLDLSIRTQSPGSSEHSYLDQESNSVVHSTPTVCNEKIPTHGTDISVAQHKRVFQCPHCTFWASTASRFHVHIVGHLNKKPFECSLCSYRSNWRWDITKHIKLKSVRDPAHESARVLMTDETGRRNYTKYNKYLTEIHVTGEQSLDTSGGSGTRHRHHEKHLSSPNGKSENKQRSSEFNAMVKAGPLRPPPALKVADVAFFAKVPDKKRSSTENKKTLFKCKKCNFRDASREVLLQHVKGHYAMGPTSTASLDTNMSRLSAERDERHCRLKHGGDIRVVSSKNGQEKVEIEEQTDEPDHVDVVQNGTFKCQSCPFSNDNHAEFEGHLEGHKPKEDTIYRCHYCSFFVSQKANLVEHLQLHGVNDAEEFLNRVGRGGEDLGKRFRCAICPYVTNSKSQYTYHKQFHKPRGGQYACTHCSYNVSKRHLLHQHLKVHGISITPHKQNGDALDLEEITDEIEEVPSASVSFESHNFIEIPLVWVSKGDKFMKMFKCRFCPHVNLRKVNIQEHEKMHSVREKNPNAKGTNEAEHRCTECNYVCNNAGVLSSHSKVHQGLYGTVKCLVDPMKSDDEQIKELSQIFNTATESPPNEDDNGEPMETNDEMADTSEAPDGLLHFCNECPARFLKENEFTLHTTFHGVRLFYKCENCTYTSREKPHLLAHNLVHTNQYQDRTKELQAIYRTNIKQPQPQIYPITSNRTEPIWVVYDNNDTYGERESSPPVVSKPSKSVTVPLSGTELFQQKSEAQKKHAAERAARRYKEPSPPYLRSDPQFGTLMHGNPEFIYPTCMKNGKKKEKRYKCHNCPSAFEKREQYKVHLGLHGANERYKCEHCDYSVRYSANYVQHKKKHEMNDKAQAERRLSDEIGEDVDENEEVTGDDISQLAVDEDETTLPLIEDQLASSTSELPIEEGRKFSCPLCPYSNHRKEEINSHQEQHLCVSGVRHAHTCDFCDFTVSQAHILEDHVKLHIDPSEVSQDDSDYLYVKEKVSVSEIKAERFNNNEGEKLEKGDIATVKIEN